jgi:hypothetical protein
MACIKWIACFLLAAALSLGQSSAFPIQGSNGVVTCTIYDAYRNPVGENESNNITLNADLAVYGTENVSITLIDSLNNSYEISPELSAPLQSGRAMMVFVIPMNSTIKGINVEPDNSEPFLVFWPGPLMQTNGVANLRFWGVMGDMVESNLKSLIFDVSLSNNATSGEVLLGPQNITFVDQWGWRYFADESFEAVLIPPKNRMRAAVTFSDVSPRSRPAKLEYDFWKDSRIVVDIENCSSSSTAESAQSRKAETATIPTASDAAAKQPAEDEKTSLQPPSGNATDSSLGQASTNDIGSAKETVEDVKNRLSKIKAKLGMK